MSGSSLIAMSKPVSTAGFGAARGATWSPDGVYCMLNCSNSPYRQCFKLVNGVLSYVPAANLGGVPTLESRGGVWSNDSRWYIYGGQQNMRVMRNNFDDTFTSVYSSANEAYSETTLNPNNDIIMAALTVSPWMKFWAFDPDTGQRGTLKTITYVGGGPTSRVYTCYWSRDGQYVLMVGPGSPYHWIYKVALTGANTMTLTRVTISSGNEPGQQIWRGDFSFDSTRYVTYSADGWVRVYTISGTTATLSATFNLGIGATGPGARFSKDMKKIYVHCDIGIAVLYYNKNTNLIAGDVGPNTQPASIGYTVAEHPSGQYIAASYTDSDYLNFFQVVPDAVIKTTYGKYTGLIKAPNTLTIKATYGKYTGAIAELHQFAIPNYAYGKQTASIIPVIYETEYPDMPVKGLVPPSIMLEPILPVTRSEDPGPLPQIDTAYGKYRATILPKYIFPAPINVTYGKYDGVIRGPQTADLNYSYGTYTAQIFGPLDAVIEDSYGTQTAEILIDPLKYPTELLYSYGRYTAALEANFPVGGYLITSYEKQKTAIVGDFPIATDIFSGYGKYRSEIKTQHNFATIADTYQRYSAGLEIFQSPNGPILGVYGAYRTDIRIDYGPILNLNYAYGKYTGVLEASRPQSIVSRYGKQTAQIVAELNYARINYSYGKYVTDIRPNVPKAPILKYAYGAYQTDVRVLPGRFVDANYRYGKYTGQLSMEPEFPSKITFMIIQP